MDALKSDDIIKALLKEKSSVIERYLSGTILMLRAPMAQGVDDMVRREIENIAPAHRDGSRLIVVLETTGGSIEVVERISDVFRHHFESVAFVIPSFAYSAGTVLSLSGDEIFMDYYSVLGPIDPQIRNRDGRWVPGIGYLDKYNDLIEKSAAGTLSMAELEFLVRKFDPAELFALEQAKKHSEDLIRKWLCEYKFKDWVTRESSGELVTEEYKANRAGEIAQLLGDPKEWNSHGRGIPLRVLESDRVKLKITNFGNDDVLNKAIREYYDLLMDYCAKIGAEIVVHTSQRLVLVGA